MFLLKVSFVERGGWQGKEARKKKKKYRKKDKKTNLVQTVPLKNFNPLNKSMEKIIYKF